ncbi:MAG: cytochrome c [Vicinamibacterales bacterium]
MRTALAFCLVCTLGIAKTAPAQQTATDSQKNGAELYGSACAACHGPDGTGAPRATVGFDLPLPDFTDCSFGSPEADADWIAVVHEGGRARAFDPMMPAFGDALSGSEIARVVDHLRTLCTEDGWPRGDLNLPRPLATEKAFPENEAVLTSTFSPSGSDAVASELLYERRVGRRGQYEIAVPFELRETEAGNWGRGLGDIALAYKHVLFDSLPSGSILSGGTEIIFPTGKEAEGLGSGATVFEPFGTFSQMLPRDGFLHLHAGFEIPAGREGAHTESFWRAAVGRTFVEQQWYRAWSPMLELLGARTLANGEPAMWDVLPQIQVSLSTRQHVLLNAGLRVPINQRQNRGNRVMVYLLWDWFDGGLFTGW